jgi:hypothetical protein
MVHQLLREMQKLGAKYGAKLDKDIAYQPPHRRPINDKYVYS